MHQRYDDHPVGTGAAVANLEHTACFVVAGTLLPAGVLNMAQRSLAVHIVIRPAFAGVLNASARLVVFNCPQRLLTQVSRAS